MIYKGYSGTQTLLRTKHSLSEIYLKIQIFWKIGNHAKNMSWLPFAKSLFVHHPNAMVFCLTITRFLIQYLWDAHSVFMRRSFSIYEALIQYLWGAHSVPFGRKQLTIWNITHYLKECFGWRGIINGYDSTYQLCISETNLHYYIREELWYYFFF